MTGIKSKGSWETGSGEAAGRSSPRAEPGRAFLKALRQGLGWEDGSKGTRDGPTDDSPQGPVLRSQQQLLTLQASVRVGEGPEYRLSAAHGPCLGARFQEAAHLLRAAGEEVGS